MIRKIVITGFLFVLGANLTAAEIPLKTAAEEEAGFALLESLVLSFATMAAKGTGGYEEVNSVIQNLMSELKKAKADKKVDSVFFGRYHRMLVIMKITIIDTSYDPEGILDRFIIRELKGFIDDVTGVKTELPPSEHRGIGAIAGAIAEEVLNLHIYLENKKKRAGLIEYYQSLLKKE